MEPLSTALFTILLAAPAIPTRRPEWEASFVQNAELSPMDWVEFRSLSRTQFNSSLNGTIHETLRPTTDLLISPKAAYQYPSDRKDMLTNEIMSYSLLTDGWDGDGSLKPSLEQIKSAQNFIMILPSGIPLPTPMLASDGEIGFYWDLESAYADIHLENSGLFSLYTRERFGNLEENYIEVTQENINSVWLLDNLSLLNYRELQLAA